MVAGPLKIYGPASKARSSLRFIAQLHDSLHERDNHFITYSQGSLLVYGDHVHAIYVHAQLRTIAFPRPRSGSHGFDPASEPIAGMEE